MRDLLTGKERGLKWCRDRVAHLFWFFERHLRLPSNAEIPFKLFGWEQFVYGSLFGWEGPDGYRRFREAYVEVGKGNGKSPSAAGVGLYMLTSDEESQPEILCCGPIKDQGRIVWNNARLMVEHNPELKEVVKVHKAAGVLEANDGRFALITAASGTKDGPIVHCGIVDEVHEQKDPETIRRLSAGFKTRKQPLLLEITNSGSDKTSIAWSHHERARHVLEGTIVNDSIFGFIAGVDPGDKPLQDSACWLKANPSLGQPHSIDEKYIREQIAGATTPQAQATVLRLNFGIWTRAEDPAFDMDGWANGAERVDGARQRASRRRYVGRVRHGVSYGLGVYHWHHSTRQEMARALAELHAGSERAHARKASGDTYPRVGRERLGDDLRRRQDRPARRKAQANRVV